MDKLKLKLGLGCMLGKLCFLRLLTVVDPITNIASPAPLVDKVDEGIDIGAALPTSAEKKYKQPVRPLS